MTKKERYEKVIAWFQENVPVAETELHYNNPYELLIAVILSAQCTDKRVKHDTPRNLSGFPPEPEAAGCYHTGGDIRVHTQRILPQ